MKRYVLTALIGLSVSGYALAGISTWSYQFASNVATADTPLEVSFDGYGSPGDPDDLITSSRYQVPDFSGVPFFTRQSIHQVTVRPAGRPRVRGPPPSLSG